MEKKHMFSNRDLRKLLIPLVVEQILNSLMGTADSIMVSNVGPAAISAVSLVDSINILVIQAFYALAAGGAIICSQYIGQGDHKNAGRSADVYKRQVYGCADDECRNQFLAESASSNAGHGSGRRAAPVSYTHLDVYKRQLPPRG